MSRRTTYLIVSAGWTGLVGLVLAILVYQIVAQYRISSFATAEGVVDSVTFSLPYLPDTENAKPLCHVRIAYHFLVKGKRYTGERIERWGTSFPEAEAAQLAQRFRAGSRPTVHYDPANPADSLLIADMTSGLL